MPINFYIQPPLKYRLEGKKKIKEWVKAIITAEGKYVGNINYIFCTDEELYQMNVAYLSHQTYTDIITFDNSDDPRFIEGDIFISIDRVSENAAKFGVSVLQELHRVMAHGILHLLGYKDKTPEQQALMRHKEEECLLRFEKM
ncbi:rRNA maturation RNase YbeY [Sphingobacteriales bacterium UPWRP_1]|nr:rRNA maturation RNase YbeY [Sphingobacteriales bacterium TSM_CSS]PSJ74028.1 rRNA maturation RNase YbeY [Sphingobacteriales bacterium UPWRP_1]